MADNALMEIKQLTHKYTTMNIRTTKDARQHYLIHEKLIILSKHMHVKCLPFGNDILEWEQLQESNQ